MQHCTGHRPPSGRAAAEAEARAAAAAAQVETLQRRLERARQGGIRALQAAAETAQLHAQAPPATAKATACVTHCCV